MKSKEEKLKDLANLAHITKSGYVSLTQEEEYVPMTLTIDGSLINVNLKVKGHLIVTGECEKSILKTELGSIFFMYGSMKGSRIEAGLNIYVKFADHARLISHKDVILELSVLESEIYAGDRLLCESWGGKIVGGKIVAENEIKIREIGNRLETATYVEIISKAGSITFEKIHPNVSVKIGNRLYQFTEPVQDGNLKCLEIIDNRLCMIPMNHFKTPDGRSVLKKGTPIPLGMAASM